jgi:hypothetical protein
MRKWGDAVLLLPFAWIGLVGGFAVADAYKLGESREDQCIRAGLVLATPLVACALGWLLGSLRSKVAGRVAAFVFGTPLAGAINGAIIGLLLTVVGRVSSVDASAGLLFGALIGGGHGLVFLPALTPGFVAYLRVGRARRESFVDRADRRAIIVVTAGMGALIAWAFCPVSDEGFVRRAIIVAGLVVGFVGLVEDEIAYTRVSAALRTQGLAPVGAPLLAGPSAQVLDFGLGYKRAEVVVPAHDAYRDAPRRAGLFLGDGLEARKSLRNAILRDAVVASVSLLFALWR